MPKFGWLLRVGLTLWMGVLACSISFSHCHSDGAAAHPHGHGWGLFPECFAEVGIPGGTPGECHQHLLVLGFELPGEEGPTSVSDPSVGLDTQGNQATAWPPDGDARTILERDPAPRPIVSRDRPTAFLPISRPASPTPFAERRLSGVLRP